MFFRPRCLFAACRSRHGIYSSYLWRAGCAGLLWVARPEATMGTWDWLTRRDLNPERAKVSGGWLDE